MTAATLEFFINAGQVMVIYNLQTMDLEEFCRLDGSKTILQKICRAVRLKYPPDNQCDHYACEDKKWRNEGDCGYAAVTGAFIKKHFLKLNRTLDVVVSADTDHVVFNFEN